MRLRKEMLGGRLRAARLKSRLSQDAVAEMIGVKRQSVSAWETGVSGPTALQVAELAVVYCMSAHELLFGVEFQKVNIHSLVQSRALAQ